MTEFDSSQAGLGYRCQLARLLLRVLRTGDETAFDALAAADLPAPDYRGDAQFLTAALTALRCYGSAEDFEDSLAISAPPTWELVRASTTGPCSDGRDAVRARLAVIASRTAPSSAPSRTESSQWTSDT